MPKHNQNKVEIEKICFNAFFSRNFRILNQEKGEESEGITSPSFEGVYKCVVKRGRGERGQNNFCHRCLQAPFPNTIFFSPLFPWLAKWLCAMLFVPKEKERGTAAPH